MTMLFLLLASVGRSDEGGDWRDRVTLIANERLRGELVGFRSSPRTSWAGWKSWAACC